MGLLRQICIFLILVIVGGAGLSGCVGKSGGSLIPGEGGFETPLGDADDPSIGGIDPIDGSIGDQPPTDGAQKVGLRLDAGDFPIDDGVAKRWDGCDANQWVQGGFQSDQDCGKAFLHPLFAEHLEAHLFSCLQKAGSESQTTTPTRVFIRHRGTYESGANSLHARARAMDIEKIILRDDVGNASTISMDIAGYAGAQATFYDSFRSCWNDSMPESCIPGQPEFRGSIGHTQSQLGGNSLHNDHLHLSFPLCAGENP